MATTKKKARATKPRVSKGKLDSALAVAEARWREAKLKVRSAKDAAKGAKKQLKALRKRLGKSLKTPLSKPVQRKRKAVAAPSVASTSGRRKRNLSVAKNSKALAAKKPNRSASRRPKKIVRETASTSLPVMQTPVMQTPVMQTPVMQTPVMQTPVMQTPVSSEGSDS